MNILHIAAISLVGVFISITIKKEAPIFAAAISLVTGLIIFFQIAEGLEMIVETVMRMSDQSGMNKTYISMVIRIAAVAYICQFVGDICSDAGEKSTADKVEMAGKVIIAVMSAPIILSLMEAVTKYI